MNKLLYLLFIIIIFSDCTAQKTQGCSDTSLLKEQWLQELVEGREKAAVFLFQHRNSAVVEYHHCYQCPDAIVTFYTCSGKKICYQGGFMGANTCAEEFERRQQVQIYPKE